MENHGSMSMATGAITTKPLLSELMTNIMMMGIPSVNTLEDNMAMMVM
jgi:hypothetical protein